MLGACSISLPGMSRLADGPDATASLVDKGRSTLSRELGPEDWARARTALAKALDPHGANARVAWSNPKSALSGSFTPSGLPFVESDEICRVFEATVAGQGSQSPQVSQSIKGKACRPSGGDWAIKSAKPVKA